MFRTDIYMIISHQNMYFFNIWTDRKMIAYYYLRNLPSFVACLGRDNKNLPGTEQTVLNVITWVRSQEYRHSRRACTELLIKT